MSPNPNELGSLRRSQVITTFGPGAVVDFRTGGTVGASVSAVVAGLEYWTDSDGPAGGSHLQRLYEPRLQAMLRVWGFREPPVATDRWRGDSRGKELRAMRFPSWLQCPDCKVLAREGFWQSEPGKAEKFCGRCSGGASYQQAYVVPVRFVAACPAGHLSEFPWHYWVRHKEECTANRLMLRSVEGSGLSSLLLICPECDAKRPMEGCFGEGALGVSCRGERPWLRADDESCDRTLRTVQRGASNLYFPVIRSALDIPPWSDPLQRKLGDMWPRLLRKEDADARRMLIEVAELHKELEMDIDDLAAQVEERIAMLDDVGENLRRDEYRQFISGGTFAGADGGEESEFRVENARCPPELAPYIEGIVLAHRLREVRALQGFTRIFPPDSDESTLAPIAVDESPDWLPAVEVRGEGIFLYLRSERVEEWESQSGLDERIRTIRRASESSSRSGQPVTARFLLVHSLAHALIRTISLECGYSSASLRERLYVGDEMAGLLIYTATPDSDGTLGGLVEQGREERLMSAFLRALEDALWCAADPLCIDGVATLSEPQNNAACHNCMLLPETSCEEFNRLLDRALLVGTSDQHSLGYFAEFIRGGGSEL